jgi:hypothetical protein
VGEQVISAEMTVTNNGAAPLWKSNISFLTAAFLAAGTTGGTTYAFGIYGEALKQTLHLSQSQLDTISSANFCAGIVSWIPGLVVDRLGPRFALWFGGLLSAFSLCTYWAVARDFIHVPHVLIVPTLCTLGLLIFSSSALITGAVFKVIVGTCGPGTKGSAVGAAKGYVGLGSGAYACMFESLALGNDLDFLPMCACFSVMAVTVPAIFLLPPHVEFDASLDKMTPVHLRLLYASLIGLAILVVGTSISELHHSKTFDVSSIDEVEGRGLGGMVPHYGRALLTMSCWFAPIVGLLFVPIDYDDNIIEEEGQSLENADQIDNDEEHILTSSQSQRHADPLGNEHCNDEMENGAIVQQHLSTEESKSEALTDRTLFEMLKTPTAWLFAWTSIILVGGGTLMTNNMGEMVKALHFSPIVSAASLSLFSVAQSGGRVITGVLSEWALSLNVTRCGISRGVPRPAFLILASLVGASAHLLLSVATTEGPFVFGVALSGAAFGMVWPLMVLIIGEVFGTAHVGANYMFYDGFSSAMGTLFLAKFLSQSVYESHIDHSDDNNNTDNLTCYGQECFRASQLIVAGLSLSCVLTSIGMLRTTRQTYDAAAQATTYEALSTSEHDKADTLEPKRAIVARI